MFPLNTVLFRVTMPLHVFEDRYRALVHHLLTIHDRSERLFGAVRSGRATRSARTARGRCTGSAAWRRYVSRAVRGRALRHRGAAARFRLDAMDTSGLPVGQVTHLPDDRARPVTEEAAGPSRRSRSAGLAVELRGADVLDGPSRPTYLSYTLAATCC
jgi:Lon protease-like protein